MQRSMIFKTIFTLRKPLLHFCAIGMFYAAGLTAQPQLTMSDAILKGRGPLAPANLKQLQWVPGTAQFTHVVNNKVVRVNAPDLKMDTTDLLAGINAGLPAVGHKLLENMPAVSWLNADEFWFHTETSVLSWSAKNGLKKQNQHPEDADDVDIHEKTYQLAYTRDKGLYIAKGGRETLVAQSKSDSIVYGKSVHRDEFGINKGTFWSPSGRYLAFYRMDQSMVTQYPIYVLDSMPAQARKVFYPFAGAKSHHVTVGVYDTQSGKTLYLQTGEPAEQYLTNVVWTPDDRFILVAVVNRAQNQMWLKQFDATTGAYVKTVFEEKSDKWVEPEKPAAFVPGHNDQFIWQSERDGYNHLYLYDLSGKMLRQLSTGMAPVTSFYGFSVNGAQCFYQMADETGLNRHLMATDLKTGQSTRLTREAGIHNGLFNSAGEWMLDVFTNATTPRFVHLSPVTNPDKQKLIFSAKNPLDGYAIGQTRLLTIPSPGGVNLNARLILPPNYNPDQKYPVLVYVYNGPHVQMVTNTWLGGGELWMHRLAQQGFVIFSIDGRGSANRGLAFESAVHRQLGTLEIEDQLAGVQYLKTQSYIDPARIGVYGWSYGGFMTTSLMTRPEANGIFKCGIAGGPVIDWRMYEIMYTERYMDTPQENPEGYNKSSLFNYVDNLKGRLLMIHGTSDDVVVWQHSLRYIRECVRKGKQIDYFAYPEHLHNVIGKDRVHLFEKIERFFKENLQETVLKP